MKKSELKIMLDEKKCRIEDVIPSEWIGQGSGFKTYDWENVDLDEIVYIPECAYTSESTDMELVYSKKDFIDICNGDEQLAITIHDAVDWQCPETLYDEWGYNDLE